jgi:hypothetical protein
LNPLPPLALLLDPAAAAASTAHSSLSL